MSKGKRRLNNCKRKVAYFSWDETLAAIEEVKRSGKLLEPEITSPYLCLVCHHYHWGRKKELKH